MPSTQVVRRAGSGWEVTRIGDDEGVDQQEAMNALGSLALNAVSERGAREELSVPRHHPAGEADCDIEHSYVTPPQTGSVR